MAGRQTKQHLLDRELDHLPDDLRWREWMGRVEAVLFAAPEPVKRDALSRLVGRACNLDLLIGDIREALKDRPYDLVESAGGWQFQTRRRYGDVIRAASGVPDPISSLSERDMAVLTAIAYQQPVTRAELGEIFGVEIGRETLNRLSRHRLIAPGPRSPSAGAPYTYVTTDAFLTRFTLATIDDLPDLDLEMAQEPDEV
ncbi:SMC-Scp complex subunit ScpB [Coralliovum pocilloporae]|uniref:SMC-Scp complex subunit ScpB n=1 Tax=Coralliovum pocilloporae TaxID=3066369 RepID=UPI003306CCB8